MFTDFIQKLTLVAGKGGNGIVAWRREKFIPKGGPCGGNGGKGGSVILQSDPQILSLESFRNKSILKAENGLPGGKSDCTGRDGQDLIIKVPKGTLVLDPVTKEILFDFTKNDQEFLICQGGVGGKGNTFFKSPTHQAPNKCSLGRIGESKQIELELKLIADVGLIGMPNAGKSTFLSKISKTKAKIAPYPFTTLSPNLGLVEFDDYSRILVADIPGIIENAHKNKGLGLAFLKHIERTCVLVFLIDISPLEEKDPEKEFEILRNELEKYNPEILKKPFLVALNKVDEDGAKERFLLFKKNYPFPPETLFCISALQNTGCPELLEAIRSLAQEKGKKFS